MKCESNLSRRLVDEKLRNLQRLSNPVQCVKRGLVENFSDLTSSSSSTISSARKLRASEMSSNNIFVSDPSIRTRNPNTGSELCLLNVRRATQLIQTMVRNFISQRRYLKAQQIKKQKH